MDPCYYRSVLPWIHVTTDPCYRGAMLPWTHITEDCACYTSSISVQRGFIAVPRGVVRQKTAEQFQAKYAKYTITLQIRPHDRSGTDMLKLQMRAERKVSLTPL